MIMEITITFFNDSPMIIIFSLRVTFSHGGHSGSESSELVSTPAGATGLKAATILLPLSVITVMIFSCDMSHSCIHLSTHTLIVNAVCGWATLFKGQQYVLWFL